MPTFTKPVGGQRWRWTRMQKEGRQQFKQVECFKDRETDKVSRRQERRRRLVGEQVSATNTWHTHPMHFSANATLTHLNGTSSHKKQHQTKPTEAQVHTFCEPIPPFSVNRWKSWPLPLQILWCFLLFSSLCLVAYPSSLPWVCVDSVIQVIWNPSNGLWVVSIVCSRYNLLVNNFLKARWHALVFRPLRKLSLSV